VLDAIADAPLMCDLSCKPGAGVNAVTIASLGSLVLPALSHPDPADRFHEPTWTSRDTSRMPSSV